MVDELEKSEVDVAQTAEDLLSKISEDFTKDGFVWYRGIGCDAVIQLETKLIEHPLLPGKKHFMVKLVWEDSLATDIISLDSTHNLVDGKPSIHQGMYRLTTKKLERGSCEVVFNNMSHETVLQSASPELHSHMTKALQLFETIELALKKRFEKQ